MINLVWLVPLIPLLGFVINGLGRNSLSKSLIGFIGSSVIFISFAISLGIFFELGADANKSHEIFLFNWISAGTLEIPLSFLVDPLSSLMLLIITGVGFLIHIYSIGYMHSDEGFGKFFSYLYGFFSGKTIIGSSNSNSFLLSCQYFHIKIFLRHFFFCFIVLW